MSSSPTIILAGPTVLSAVGVNPPHDGVVAFNQAVFALAPAVLGVLRDISTSYVVPFALAVAMQIVAALIVLIRPPRRSASE
jgi:hypothetical protein